MKKSILSILAAGAVLLSLSSCKDDAKGGSGDAVTLKMLFQPGTRYSYDVDMKMNIEQSAMGQSMKMTNNMLMESSYEVAGDEGDNKKLKVTYDRMKMDIVSPMINMKYDSKDTAGSTPELSAMGAMVGRPFTITVNSKGEILKVEGMSEMIGAMRNEQMQAQFNDSAVRGMMQQSMNIYPERPVKVGDTWNRSYTTNMNGMNVKNDNTYKLLKVSNGIADVDVNTKMTIDGGESAAMKGVKMNIGGTQTGTMHIEIASGLIQSADLKQDIKGDVEANTMKIPMTITSAVSIKGRKN